MLGEINVPVDASDEVIDSKLLSEIDFNFIRSNVQELRELVNKHGAFREILEKTEKSQVDELTRTLNNAGNWVCAGLEKIDKSKVWTEFFHPYHNYSWIENGYFKPSKKGNEIRSWYISDKAFSETDKYSCGTEYVINIFEGDDSDYAAGYRAIDLWSLIGLEDLSDRVIVDNMAH